MFFGRELMQNSDDAKATAFELRLTIDETTNKISEIVAANDGQVFSDNDWKRLHEICSGNPDERVVG